MDAVAETKTHVEHTLKGWAQDGEMLFKTAQAAGVDIEETLKGTRLVTTITGTFTGDRPQIRSSSRRRRTARRRPGAGGNGTVTGEQLMTYLQEHPEGVNQSQLAAHFGVSRATIAKRLDTLGDQVHYEGDGASKLWHARELQPA